MLGVWLQSYGLDCLSIGSFGLMHLPWALKFIWAPLLDQGSLPFLKKRLGQRRSWLCLMISLGIFGLLALTCLDPLHHLNLFFLCGLIVNFAAASQHVLLLTYQMETLESREWGIGESMGVFGYRLALITIGAGALYLATFFEWATVYRILSLFLGIGLIAVLSMGEPPSVAAHHAHRSTTYKEWFRYAVIGPFTDFTRQSGWKAILVFMVIYRWPDNLLTMMESLFFLKLGFSYIEIANVSKVFGLGATLMGSFLGGYLIRMYRYQRTLFIGGAFTGLSCLLYLVQEELGANFSFLYLTVGIHHFFSAIALIAFFSYQLTCCQLRFAATQLALLTSCVALSRTLIAPFSGFMVEFFGWQPYFILATLSSLPGLFWIRKIPFSRP